MDSNIIIRPATVLDHNNIAQIVKLAIGDTQTLIEYCGENYMHVLSQIAKSPLSQYSWNNSIIAMVNGTFAGGIIGYDGKDLLKLREETYRIIKQYTGLTPFIPDETAPGEFYLDSLAVNELYRGMGIAKRLISEISNRAFLSGHSRVGLIVDYDNPTAESLYLSIGFKNVGDKNFFNHKMKHLVLERK